jgi:putative colanic acid biosynthesis acetyltransferase WcaF
MKIDLGSYRNNAVPGDRNRIWKSAWYLCNACLFQSPVVLPARLKAVLLRLFGGRVGRGLVIRPRVTIKYPWFLELGDHVWIGEAAWIDNMCAVKIGSHVCISQGAYLFTGNHDYRDPHFRRFVQPVVLEEGVWVGARSTICAGAHLKRGAVVAAGSVLAGVAKPYVVYQGNPAIPRHRRRASEAGGLGDCPAINAEGRARSDSAAMAEPAGRAARPPMARPGRPQVVPRLTDPLHSDH